MNVKKQTVGVAVVGLGVGEQHARAYLETGRCELRWLYDLDTARSRRVARDLGTGEVASHFEQLLEDADTHAISIASYDDAHFMQVVAALEAGKHVFVEKPLCQTAEQLAVIKRAWLKHGGELKLSANFVLRAAPAYQWVKQRVEAGEFGTLYAFDGDYLYGRLEKITAGWRQKVKPYSVMQGGGVHLVDLLLWLTGEKPQSAHAVGNRICTARTAFLYPDYVAATLSSSSGLIGRVSANFGCMHRHQHVVRLFGTEATFVYDDAGPRWHRTRDASVASTPLRLSPLPATKGALIPQFIEAISSDIDLEAETQGIFDVTSVCAAVDHALQSGSAVEVGYV